MASTTIFKRGSGGMGEAMEGEGADATPRGGSKQVGSGR
jgi:hypothetical protein